MQKIAILLGAAAMAAVMAVPASAAYMRLGSVDVGYRHDNDTAYSRFGGRLESLRLTASRSDIFCRSVVVRFENGDTQNVFSGSLDERRPVDVDLRGRARKVDSIRFSCRSERHRGGQIYIEGETGRYRGEWGGPMGGPGRDHRDDSMMGGPGRDHMRGGPRGDWSSIGRMSFEGRNDRESNFTGWRGNHVDRIGLRPIETDARCGSIVVTLQGGRKIKLADGRVLERGRVSVYDLPGNNRNIEKIYLRCRAEGAYRVTIEVMADH